MTITFVSAEPEHPDAVRLIAEGDAEFEPLYPPEVQYALSPEELAEIDTWFFLVVEDERAIATGAVALMKGYAELKRLFVTSAARGRGLSHQIIEHLEAVARDNHRDVMRLETGEKSPEALRLYADHGYERRAPFGHYEENGASDYMEKRLA